jgi:hypothetical protein
MKIFMVLAVLMTTTPTIRIVAPAKATYLRPNRSLMLPTKGQTAAKAMSAPRTNQVYRSTPPISPYMIGGMAPNKYSGICEPVQRKAIASKLMKRWRVICRNFGLIHGWCVFSSTYWGLMIVILSIAIGTETILLIVVIMARNTLVGVNCFEILNVRSANFLVHVS